MLLRCRMEVRRTAKDLTSKGLRESPSRLRSSMTNVSTLLFGAWHLFNGFLSVDLHYFTLYSNALSHTASLIDGLDRFLPSLNVCRFGRHGSEKFALDDMNKPQSEDVGQIFSWLD